MCMHSTRDPTAPSYLARSMGPADGRTGNGSIGFLPRDLPVGPFLPSLWTAPGQSGYATGTTACARSFPMAGPFYTQHARACLITPSGTYGSGRMGSSGSPQTTDSPATITAIGRTTTRAPD